MVSRSECEYREGVAETDRQPGAAAERRAQPERRRAPRLRSGGAIPRPYRSYPARVCQRTLPGCGVLNCPATVSGGESR